MLVPLPVAVVVALILAAVEEVVELKSRKFPTWAHGLDAYAFVTVIIAAISKSLQKSNTKTQRSIFNHRFVQQWCNF